MEEKSLADIQREVDQYISQFKEGYFSPLALLARMSEEVGELAREVNHEFGEKKKKASEADAHNKVMHKFNTRDADRWTRIEDGPKD